MDGTEGKGREGKGREGKGREGKGREGKGREGKGRKKLRKGGRNTSSVPHLQNSGFATTSQPDEIMQNYKK
jgi:hypothetical protein